jgi:hypothetical protein
LAAVNFSLKSEKGNTNVSKAINKTNERSGEQTFHIKRLLSMFLKKTVRKSPALSSHGRRRRGRRRRERIG